MIHVSVPGRRGMGLALAAACLSLVTAACAEGSGPSATPSQPTLAPSATPPPAASAGTSAGAGTVCPWLTAADFARFGVEGAGTPTDNPDGPDNHYCVYAGASGATGGIELDVFFGPDAATAKETYRTATGEGPAGRPATGFAFDESAFAVDGKVAYLTVRQDSLVISLAVPNEPDAEASLVELAKLVIQRALA